MEPLVQIDFQGMEPVEHLRHSITKHIDDLKHRFGRITSCRVVVKGPTAHHRRGAYEINIRLALPDGREVNVARTPDQDERFIDPDFALSDAFNHARRRLQDQVRRMQGKVKRHENSRVPQDHQT